MGPKQTIYGHLADVAQALGHAHRLELLEHLAILRRQLRLVVVEGRRDAVLARQRTQLRQIR